MSRSRALQTGLHFPLLVLCRISFLHTYIFISITSKLLNGKENMFPTYSFLTSATELDALQFWLLMRLWGHVVPSLLPNAASTILIDVHLVWSQLTLDDKRLIICYLHFCLSWLLLRKQNCGNGFTLTSNHRLHMLLAHNYLELRKRRPVTNIKFRSPQTYIVGIKAYHLPTHS